jgi:hypothetical protein
LWYNAITGREMRRREGKKKKKKQARPLCLQSPRKRKRGGKGKER